MRSDRQRLLHDVMHDDPSEREAVRRAAEFILRRRRQRRHGRLTLSLLGLALGTSLAIQNLATRLQPPPEALSTAPPREAGALTDDELLALFPDTPVALATMADGKKR